MDGDEGRALRADARRSRARIVEAVFASSGDFRDLTLDDVARAAGVGRSTLFRHFATREELLSAAVRQAIDEGGAVQQEALADGPTPQVLFRRMSVNTLRLAGRFRVLGSNRDLVRRLVEEDASSGGQAELLAWIADARARGELRAELDPPWIARLLVATSLAAAESVLDEGRTPEEAAHLLERTWAGAFLPPTA